MKNSIDMTEGSIPLKLIQFTVPLILSSILQLLFNACDVVVVGRYAGNDALAAVGSTGPLINLITNLFIGLGIGSNVVCASYFGQGDKRAISYTVHTTVLISFIGGLLLTAIGVLFCTPLLTLMRSPDGVIELSSLYLKIYFGGITPTIVFNFCQALLRSKGDTRRPLYILIISGILNLLLNLLFVIRFHMSVMGVGLATVISQSLACISILYILATEKDAYHLFLHKLKVHRSIFLKIIRIGLPAGVQGIIFSFSNVIIQSSVNSFGPVTISGNSASQSVEGFVYISMNSLAQGTLTFTSQNMGAGKRNRVLKSVLWGVTLVTLVGLIFGNTVRFFSESLISLYSRTPEVINSGKIRIGIICSTYALCGIMDVLANGIRGMGYSSIPMITTLLGACGVRLIWLFTVFQMPRFHTIQCVYLSYPISWIITIFALSITFSILYNKNLTKSE